MFGKRATPLAPRIHQVEPQAGEPAAAPPPPVLTVVEPTPPPRPAVAPEADTRFVEIKVAVFNTLLQTVDLKEIGKLSPETVRSELSDVISEIIAIKSFVLN